MRSLKLRIRLPRPGGKIATLWLMAVAVASPTAICTIVGLMLYASRLEVANSAATAAGNISAAVVQDETRNFEVLDLSLQAVRDGVSDPAVMALPPHLRRSLLFDRAATAKDIGGLLYLDEDGRIVADSDSDLPRNQRFGNSDFFRAHIHRYDRALFISRPFLSPFDGDWCIGLSRRVDRSDGNFGGVVVAFVKLSYFGKLFRGLNLGAHGAITLSAIDGTLLMRQPLNEHDIGRVYNPAKTLARLKISPDGTYEDVSRYDGVHRLFHYQQVGTLPLVQYVGFSVDELYASWWRKAYVTISALAALCATILGLVAFLQIQLRRRTEAEAAFAHLAATDKLTGLPNRRRFDEVLEAEWQRCRRAVQPLALLMVDVDKFKAYNDTLGHLAGDALLASLGVCLRESLLRPADFAARYGGEEFVVILPDQADYGAKVVGERIKAIVAELHHPHEASATGVVSVSIGVASMVPRPHQAASELVAAADLALYEAKAAGRDRIILWTGNRHRVAA